MSLRNRILLSVLLTAALGVSAASQAANENEIVDYLALASLMLRDGNLDRALIALDQVDPDTEGVDLTRYYTLRGMAHIRRNEYPAARDALKLAIGSGEADALVYVYLAQAQFHLQDYPGVIEALDDAGSAVESVPSVYHMKAQSYWLMQDPVMALATLDQAAGIFSGDQSFLRRKVFYLVDLGLFRQAAALGREYLSQTEGRREDYVALGNALRASGELNEAAMLLEQALLKFPDSSEVRKVLAHVYIDRGQLGVAADVLYQAALLSPPLMAEAAELYRRSGQIYRALIINSQLSDQPEKFRQRLALYLQMENFEQAAAMETPLRRVGLLQEEDLRYAIAYALFKTGDFEAAENHLAALNRPDLFRKAAELRRAIQDCAQERWRCY
ncbi:tetratricopeptide repeat protein [Elongatibacter sediminis]|uniref:Tetratricopeptide repeat protein n=1 Tax=Elongatibacter sediminis TaxID=3119006 RepID=A0AAW9R9X8_9GAMM